MKNFLNKIYHPMKSVEFKTTSIYGTLIVLTVFLVIILSNIVKVQSGPSAAIPGVATPIELRSPTGTLEQQ